MPYYCDPCNRDFHTWIGLKEHYVQSPDHHYCQYCTIHFDSASQLQSHCEDEHDYCHICERAFKSGIGLHQHNQQKHANVYCIPCKRLFLSPSNYQSHLNSSVHRTKDIFCPSGGCDMAFISKSALMLHFEAGSCQSGINRRVIYDWVLDNDYYNVITDPERLGHHDGVPLIATERSWNGRAYECYRCHNQSRSLTSLNSHLASRHQKKVYRCSSCHAHFVCLSGLCQHIESERCESEEYRDQIDDLLDEVVRLTL